jgi:segregation and condensation protein A
MDQKRLTFRDIFSKKLSRSELVVTFIATLELVKMHIINIEQVNDFSEIWLVLVVSSDQLSKLPPERDLLGYG